MRLSMCVYFNCTRLRDIHSRNVHVLDLDIQNSPRSNVSKPIEWPYKTFYLLQCLSYLSPFARYVVHKRGVHRDDTYTRAHAHTHTYIHITYTHKHSHTHIHIHTHTLTHTQTPLDVLAIGSLIVHPANKDQSAFHVRSCQFIRFESLTLKMKVKNVADLDENWLTNVPCQHARVCRNASSSFVRGTLSYVS